jgi:hypothetical protein
MGHAVFRIAVVVCVLGMPCPLWAEAEATVEVNRGDQATADFKFDKIPAPSQTDAANSAKAKIVAGRRDANGGQLNALNDGKLPGNADDPRENFFFAAGSEGGRLLVDLGEETAIKRVNS